MRLQIDEALKHSVVLIEGPEDMLRRRALKELLEASGIDGDDYDSETVNADEQALIEWVGAASTIPFLSERRTVIVRNLLRYLPEDTAKLRMLSDVPETGRLILVTDEDPANADKTKKVKAAWAKAVKDAKGMTITCEIDQAKLAGEFIAHAASLGKSMSRPAAALLTEMMSGSYSRGIGEVEKLAMYAGDEAEIREEHVRASVVANPEWNIWALLDAVREKRVGEAVRQLRIVVASNKKMSEVAIVNVLPQFSRYFRLLWQARVAIEAGANPTAVPEAIASQFPNKPRWTDEKSGTTNRIIPQAKKVTLAQIEQCFQEIRLADSRLKGVEPAASDEDTMERLIMRLAEILNEKSR
ncbi:MAG: DNA polymerase III subunit delta [Chthonomonas sp.]|nr:DNA polymerase III subunit delta [Chthonomonas sp.]